jgi:penicillin-binding protein-related factor A (putative recombinase)
VKESKFNSELINSLDHWGAYAYKIPDLPASMTMGLRFVAEKPCDIIGGYHGKFFGIESKQIKNFEAFGLRHLRESQIRHLTDMVKRGNRAFVFLNIRIAAVKGKTKRENRLVIFDWADFSKMTESLKQKDVMALSYLSYQSVKKKPTDECGEIIYDIKPWLESLS